MASQVYRVNKADFVELFKNYKPTDYIGYIMTVQDGKENPAHQVFVPFEPLGDKIL